jgi:hypothetical protein
MCICIYTPAKRTHHVYEQDVRSPRTVKKSDASDKKKQKQPRRRQTRRPSRGNTRGRGASNQQQEEKPRANGARAAHPVKPHADAVTLPSAAGSVRASLAEGLNILCVDACRGCRSRAQAPALQARRTGRGRTECFRWPLRSSPAADSFPSACSLRLAAAAIRLRLRLLQYFSLYGLQLQQSKQLKQCRLVASRTRPLVSSCT